MKLTIQHVTHYDYSAPLQYALQSLCLTPQGSAHQTVHDWTVSAPAPLFAQRDGFGNTAHTWSLAKRSYGSAVRAGGTVETHASPWLTDDAVPPQLYLRTTPLTAADDRLRALGRVHLADGVDEGSAMALARAVLQRVRYQAGVTTVSTSAQEAWALGGGVCQDHAHVYIAACRANGVPVRYVSGYFYAPDEPELASHAWVDVCVEPEAHRWLSIDITHGCLMDERHVRLAVGLDYSACSPIRGVREGGGDESMRVRIDIREARAAPIC
ncbi:MAG TPA: transglutaminase family protein [Rhizobacter sp.]|nr:transglutaminase family protein [Rhizobacter sp.]